MAKGLSDGITRGNGMTNLSSLKYAVIDVDGTMTDSGIYYDGGGNELKKFTTRDAAGILAAHYIGLKIIVATGRECAATMRRMNELGVDIVHQLVKDKRHFLEMFMRENGVEKEELAYIGDDLNDLPAMSLAGFVACPADGCMEVREMADYVSGINGGCGVIQDVFRYVLNKMGKWDEFINSISETGY